MELQLFCISLLHAIKHNKKTTTKMTNADKNNRNNQIDKLSILCNLYINKNSSYSTSDINKVIDFCLNGFKVAKNEIKLNVNERLMLFIDVRKYTLEK